jgi:hypothetical protein
MSIGRAADLADELYNELVNQRLWNGIKTINKFAKAEDAQALEEKVYKLEQALVAYEGVREERDTAFRRYEKLNAVHNCMCSECVRQRGKLEAFRSHVEQADNIRNEFKRD